ncbi:Uncharacterised protein [Yersinia pseudotuberculosis]|uniref:Uncharacterized protein n=3 Tax=Yersinia TaxID=629 RepID=A0A0T9QWS4_9GAMM|nr:hypothetical protein [Yersinia pekkanenii]AJJ67784.1 putative membrane protein [Yersinia pseudotuberculosis PB1/+]MBO1563441.1 hypothetical protein [Yersinia pseudotuberculosis]CRG52451.1 Uncharacterised protein [Yersinia wautersii]CND30645.1 Uncharacterised protein [Yersinia pseudotuberculosis]CNE64328.1 Uncharacterised protein [Yersinia pseudotuberculosis]
MSSTSSTVKKIIVGFLYYLSYMVANAIALVALILMVASFFYFDRWYIAILACIGIFGVYHFILYLFPQKPD